MHIQRRICDLDFDGELYHCPPHEKGCRKEQPAAGSVFAKIQRNNRQNIENEGQRSTGLDNGDQTQALAQTGNLTEKTRTVFGRNFAINDGVMQVSN